MILWKHELKMNLKTLLIWTVCVGFTCCGCLLLFGGLEETMAEMADAYSQLGAFSAVFGMDKISMATIEGFYATEVALIFSIGGAMYAAMTGVGIVSKEEEGHTSEFLNTLPLGRFKITGSKYFALFTLVAAFQIINIVWILAGFIIAGALPPMKEFVLFHVAQLLMQLEVGSVCFLLSAVCKKKQIGAGLGFAIMLYVVDIMCRILPDIEALKYVTPFYFSNAADVFTDGRLDSVMVTISIVITVVSVALSTIIYQKRDLNA